MIETMWVEGMTMREINEAVGHGINISAARRRGWNLPYRYCVGVTPEMRIGRRAEQRRRRYRENLLKCECGQLRTREADRCMDCRREERDARWRLIQAWWAEGLSMNAIVKRLGWTRGTLSSQLNRMRKEGWDVPYRHRYPARTP